MNDTKPLITPEQFARLPKHAQNEINRLREENERLTIDNNWLRDENRVKVTTETNTFVSEGIHDDTALKPNCDVRFRLNGGSAVGWRRTIGVRVARDGESIEVMGDESLDIIVSPRSSNLIHISLRN